MASMRLAAKAAYAVSAVTIAGLVALAAPAIASICALAAPPLETAAAGSVEVEPTATSEPPVTDPTYEAAAKASAEAEGLQYLGDGISKPMGGPGNCTTDSLINIRSEGDGPMYAKLLGDPADTGAAALANGSVALDGDGRVFSCTVASGDALEAIGARLCIDLVTVAMYNHRWGGAAIQPGDVLVLRPDPSVEFIDPLLRPSEAPRGRVLIGAR